MKMTPEEKKQQIEEYRQKSITVLIDNFKGLFGRELRAEFADDTPLYKIAAFVYDNLRMDAMKEFHLKRCLLCDEPITSKTPFMMFSLHIKHFKDKKTHPLIRFLAGVWRKK